MAEDLQLNEQQQLVLNHTIISPSSTPSSSPSTPSSALFASEPSVVADGCSTPTATAGVLRVEVRAPAVNRCVACRKRVGLTGFKCRCGMTFCGTHRYPERHACGFDYKAMGKDQIAMANPVVKADKLRKI